jgi:uncharacterized DUF497 family protein
MNGFEWDESKRQRNVKDRGVDFRLAALIFRDQVIEAEDERTTMGKPDKGHWAGDEYFVVTYTWRGTNRRIISAWKVGERGQRRYQAILAGRT